MRQIEGFDLITEAGELKQLPAGAYVCKIIEVIDNADKEYLDVYFDIVEGEFKNYFTTLFNSTGKNYGRIARSYKTNALPFFKAFITAVEKSNPGYKWDWNEKSLNNKLCAVSFRDEEFESDGTIKVRAKPEEIRSVQALREGKIEIKPVRKLEKMLTIEEIMAQNKSSQVSAPTEIDDTDLPF